MSLERDLGAKFSKAIQRYIKREVSNALVQNQQYYSSPTQIKSTRQTHEGLTDMTFDTILGGKQITRDHQSAVNLIHHQPD